MLRINTIKLTQKNKWSTGHSIWVENAYFSIRRRKQKENIQINRKSFIQFGLWKAATSYVMLLRKIRLCLNHLQLDFISMTLLFLPFLSLFISLVISQGKRKNNMFTTCSLWCHRDQKVQEQKRAKEPHTLYKSLYATGWYSLWISQIVTYTEWDIHLRSVLSSQRETLSFCVFFWNR